MAFTFKKRYARLTLLLFGIEVLIALFVRDNFIRPYVGDYLVVILLYCFVCTFLLISKRIIAVAVLLFAFIIEGLQYIHIVKWLGLAHNKFARTVIGDGFEWYDLLAYTLGILTVLVFENKRTRSHPVKAGN